jgi:hypothetical protein
MKRSLLAVSLVALCLAPQAPAPACCPAPPFGVPAVNADQTVIIIWDAATKTEHFIRKASFKSDADDFGFLIPSPSQPELNESGNEAFPFLEKLTEPRIHYLPRLTCPFACASAPVGLCASPEVRVLEEKMVAGFHASVLEASSGDALVDWLKVHGYAFSPEVKAWAQPYIDAGWKITALKVAKTQDGKIDRTVSASSLRMSFKSDRPLFPYREPDSTNSAKILGAQDRLLRIFFLAETKYAGELTKDVPWTGKIVWANKLQQADWKRTLELLHLPLNTGPAECWLTEFEDHWPYRVMPADVYFSPAHDQKTVNRPDQWVRAKTYWPTDAMVYAIAAVVFVPSLVRVVRRKTVRTRQ